MHAVVISEPGGPDVLQWTEVADPRPGPGEVLVEVAAAGVNRADLMQRQGLYPPPPGAPPYPGLECSGTVAALGDGVNGWHVGEQVCALLSGGGYAEQVAVPAGQLLPAPEGHHAHRGGRAPGDGLHRVLQRLPHRRTRGRRDAARPRRRQRHRHDGDPARQARRRAGRGHRRIAAEAGRLPGPRRRHHDQLPRGGLRRQPHGGDRRPRRRRHPGHHRAPPTWPATSRRSPRTAGSPTSACSRAAGPSSTSAR